MPPKRRNVYGKKGGKGGLAYKKGDYIEYEYKGSIVTGKLNKKSLNGTEANPIWVVSPMDRRRKDEEIPEKQLGKVITAVEAMNNRAPKLGTKEEQANRAMSPMPPIAATPSTSNSSSSDGSKEEEEEEEEEPSSTSANSKTQRRSGRLTPSVDSKENTKTASKKRRNRSDDDSNDNNSGSDGAAAKSQKSVKFSQEFNDSSSSDIKKKGGDKNNKDRATTSSARRTTRGSTGEALAGLLPDVMPRKKSVPKAKKLKKNEHVVVVKMLTGTLYLHRGDRRRAEFVRTK